MAKKKHQPPASGGVTQTLDTSAKSNPVVITPDGAPYVFPPDCPPRGPLGDLTPEVITWIRDNDHDEYVRRYVRPGHPKGPRGIRA